MISIFEIIVVLNALFFIFYGFQSLNSQMMVEEFKRFGLSHSQRKLTGVLQLLGALGLLAGLIVPFSGILSAGGFTVMMFVAFTVRLKIKDSAIQSLPSVIFMMINAWLVYSFYHLLQMDLIV
ncbi:MAG TPA: DoxX family protein [Balneolaceae bacterium]|nr:DoxX family protein [Balneolaceae bacterium]